MSILNDEEIIDLVTEYHFSGVENRHILSRNVAKAQLKKVVEWGDEDCEEHGSEGYCRRECTHCWESLKQLVEE